MTSYDMLFQESSFAYSQYEELNRSQGTHACKLTCIHLQVCLLKNAAFEVAMIAIGTRFRLSEICFPTDGVYISKQRIVDALNMDFEEKFRFFAKLKKLNLTDKEIALLNTLVLTAPGEM